MTLDTTGIINENEFYTDHYLRKILKDDLKDVFSRWKKDSEKSGSMSPDQLLRALPRDYFKAKAELEKVRRLPDILEGQQEFVHALLNALGYEVNPMLRVAESDACLPILGEIRKSNGSPELWVIETVTSVQDPEDPLQQTLLPEQYPDTNDETLLDRPLVEIITREVFGLKDPPRWILFVDFNTVVLIDRSKWNEKRLLRFDINEIFGRREASTFLAMAALLHRYSICPEDGQSLLDTLDENSHKHAFQVSEDLKYSLREAIELIGNEVVWYMENKRKKGTYGTSETAEKIDAADLTLECLRYMYRLLFLFYLEARPELGYADMKSPVFRSGYSLESLSDLVMVPLTTQESRNGHYLHNSISMFFDLVYNGFEPHKQLALGFEGKPLHHTFTMVPLKSHLFDPERTPLLNRVKLRNFVLQRVLELMSLSRPKGGRQNRRSRISYAQLGINQLGAVYEGLLSYRGFFAETDLYEVKRADQDRVNELEQAFFVKEEDLTKYKDEEKVFNTAKDHERNPAWKKGTLRKYTKGTFIYRLAGRDREKSASYYTPEALTRCLVKYALKELLKDKSADEILQLKICEPAMGSAAFLNEAINQLSDAYMQLKQKELDQVLAPDEYKHERQKVKMLIADENVFGVDLNPIAVELAEVSLWLNSIHSGGFVPWFGMQLVTGNSLIGARRQMFDAALLRKKERGEKSWLDEVPQRCWPKDVGANPPESQVTRRSGMIYHFLVPDKGMANYQDKVVKKLAEQNIMKINNWRKKFTMPFSDSDIQILEKLSHTIDRLWGKHSEQLRKLREQTTDPIDIFGQPRMTDKKESTSIRHKDKRYAQELLSNNIRSSSLYRRLKMAMDYWCALWFWPIEKADLLPSRDEYLTELQLILEGQMVNVVPQEEDQMQLFPNSAPKQEMLALKDEFGFVDVEKLTEEVPRLAVIKGLVVRHHFLHWELEFADLFAHNGGFNLILGNPPWTRARFEVQGIASEFEPLAAVRKWNAATVKKELPNILNYDVSKWLDFVNEVEGVLGQRNFITSNYYPLAGSRNANLYKCFLELAGGLVESGVGALLHDSGIFDEPDDSGLRAWLYAHLFLCSRFINQLNHFPEDALGHAGEFALSWFVDDKEEVGFHFISNVFHPRTIDDSFDETKKASPIPVIKDHNGWVLNGHPSRLLYVDHDRLEAQSNAFGFQSAALRAPLASMYAKPIQDLIVALADATTVESRFGALQAFPILDETTAQREGLIERVSAFHEEPQDLILSAPHIYVGTPLSKQPNSAGRSKGDYSSIDLISIPNDFIPRTLFAFTSVSSRTALVRSDNLKRSLRSYRLAWRNWVSPSNERTLISTILPPGLLHVNGIMTCTFDSPRDLLMLAGLSFTLVYDFLVRVRNIDHVWGADTGRLPFPVQSDSPLGAEVISRALRLVCVSAEYAELWKTVTKNVNGWTRQSAARTPKERRQLLLEIDVLAAFALGLSLDDLQLIYSTQFPTFAANEDDTWYDTNGRIVFTCSRGLSGVGLKRFEWNEARDMTSGSVEQMVTEDSLPDYRKAHARIRLEDGTVLDCPCPDYPEAIPGPVERLITYEPPFLRPDRREDYRVAWEEFKRRGL